MNENLVSPAKQSPEAPGRQRRPLKAGKWELQKLRQPRAADYVVAASRGEKIEKAFSEEGGRKMKKFNLESQRTTTTQRGQLGREAFSTNFSFLPNFRGCITLTTQN